MSDVRSRYGHLSGEHMAKQFKKSRKFKLNYIVRMAAWEWQPGKKWQRENAIAKMRIPKMPGPKFCTLFAIVKNIWYYQLIRNYSKSDSPNAQHGNGSVQMAAWEWQRENGRSRKNIAQICKIFFISPQKYLIIVETAFLCCTGKSVEPARGGRQICTSCLIF